MDAYTNKPSNSASASVSTRANPRPAANCSTQTAFHDNAKYQKLLAQHSVKRRRNDYDRYIEIPSDANIPSSLRWWRDNHKSFPELAKMARDVLTLPASGCAVEREFSVSGRIATWQHNHLNSSTIADSMFYKGALKRKGAVLGNSKDDKDHES